MGNISEKCKCPKLFEELDRRDMKQNDFAVLIGASTGNVKRRKVGDVEVEFAGLSAASSGGGALGDYLSGTMYGRQLLLLMRLNFPAITVV